MNVQELMTRDVKTCHRDTNLAEVASILWESDCGALPVVDDQDKVIGVVSDRDICFAVATKGRLASEITVGEIAGHRPIFTCTPDDFIQDALATMKQHQIRRVPVVNHDGKIAGILSIRDVVLAAQAENRGAQQGVSGHEALSTLQAICEHRSAQNTASALNAAQA